jgi:threonine dehydrogenase-like Zn-dependent dehydrogenase
MPTVMTQAALELVPAGTPNSQAVAVLEKPGDIQMRHALIPTPGPGQVRVKITYVGICGSDLEAYRGLRQPEFMSLPMRLGHEVAGVIDMLGAGTLGVAVGDKVTCRYVWGAFAEYIVCKPFNVKVLPPAFPMLETSLVEILPGVIHAAELANITPHSRVLITGQGVSGLVITQVVALYSPAVLAVTDLKDANLALAKKYGATHTYKLPSEHAATMDTVRGDFPDGFDIVIPCLLDGDGMMDALDSLTISGKIVAYGCIGTCKNFDFFKFHRKRATITATEPRRDVDMRKFFEDGVKMVTDGLVNTGEMVTHIYPLSMVNEAFALRNSAAGHDAIHVLINCDRDAPQEIVRVTHDGSAPHGKAAPHDHSKC